MITMQEINVMACLDDDQLHWIQVHLENADNHNPILCEQIRLEVSALKDAEEKGPGIFGRKCAKLLASIDEKNVTFEQLCELDDALKEAMGCPSSSPFLIKRIVVATLRKIYIEFDFGDKVRDTISGFEGIVVGIAQYIDGRKEYAVQGVCLKNDGTMPDCEWIDTQRCEQISSFT